MDWGVKLKGLPLVVTDIPCVNMQKRIWSHLSEKESEIELRFYKNRFKISQSVSFCPLLIGSLLLQIAVEPHTECQEMQVWFPAQLHIYWVTQAQLIPLHFNPLLSAALCPQHPASLLKALGHLEHRKGIFSWNFQSFTHPCLIPWGRMAETHRHIFKHCTEKKSFLTPSAQMLVLP